MFMTMRSRGDEPDEDDCQWEAAAVEEHHGDWNSFLFGIWVGDVYIAEVEEPVEGLGEEFELFIPCLLVTVTIPRAPGEPLPPAGRFSD